MDNILGTPKHLKTDYQFTAIIGMYDTPVTDDIPNVKKKYESSEISFNEVTSEVQVFVMAEDKEGVKQFKKDYPNSKIQESSAVNLGEWKISAFSGVDLPDSATPLDNFFKGHQTNKTENKEEIWQ